MASTFVNPLTTANQNADKVLACLNQYSRQYYQHNVDNGQIEATGAVIADELGINIRVGELINPSTAIGESSICLIMEISDYQIVFAYNSRSRNFDKKHDAILKETMTSSSSTSIQQPSMFHPYHMTTLPVGRLTDIKHPLNQSQQGMIEGIDGICCISGNGLGCEPRKCCIECKALVNIVNNLNLLLSGQLNHLLYEDKCCEVAEYVEKMAAVAAYRDFDPRFSNKIIFNVRRRGSGTRISFDITVWSEQIHSHQYYTRRYIWDNLGNLSAFVNQGFSLLD